MTPEARTFILKCFCGQVSAVEVAHAVNKSSYRTGDRITAAQVRDLWEAECEANPVLRELVDRFGERPVRGFLQCEHTRLAEVLVSA